ncbi:TIGR02206 family membrane protein [Paenibacillus aurantius]|uniref:TIGR02206 family membrane protein n=1 Tax=Paenibacillus aurantius TaxID=2918900 RepID=A0AA96LL28_9BACL|nr:TIGR02206 family membrane protein [Paenibacillus aurantius]WNQ13352.1 TIGR02206 family membrane protein [Paenibacillus aurantius]
MYFDARYEGTFTAFSLSHLLAVAALFLAIALMAALRSRLAKRPVRLTLAGVLLGTEAALNLWYREQGIWSVQSTLPLELCSITLLLSIVMLVTRSRILYEIVYFAGIAGALQAILTPELGYPFPHFRFFQFFIAHAGIILAALYMTLVEGYRPVPRSILRVMLFLNGLAVLVWGIDRWLGANYMFLARKPENASVLDWFGPYPYYLLAEEMLALVLFLLLYWPFAGLRRKKQIPREAATGTK